ncbi:DUF4167 domain-containing protein [Bosea beijingensis]
MNLDHRRRPARPRRPSTEKPDFDLQMRHDRALARARAFEAAGDKVDAERFYQQADHFRRLLNSKASQFIAAVA